MDQNLVCLMRLSRAHHVALNVLDKYSLLLLLAMAVNFIDKFVCPKFYFLSSILMIFPHFGLQALAANVDTSLSHFQPMVALLCGHGKVHNQYLDENKKWISDRDPRATCTKNKLDILEYCRKVHVLMVVPFVCLVQLFLMIHFLPPIGLPKT